MYLMISGIVNFTCEILPLMPWSNFSKKLCLLTSLSMISFLESSKYAVEGYVEMMLSMILIPCP